MKYTYIVFILTLPDHTARPPPPVPSSSAAVSVCEFARRRCCRGIPADVGPSQCANRGTEACGRRGPRVLGERKCRRSRRRRRRQRGAVDRAKSDQEPGREARDRCEIRGRRRGVWGRSGPGLGPGSRDSDTNFGSRWGRGRSPAGGRLCGKSDDPTTNTFVPSDPSRYSGAEKPISGSGGVHKGARVPTSKTFVTCVRTHVGSLVLSCVLEVGEVR